MPLTDLQIRNAPLRDRPYKLADAQGLFLLVTPQGGKLWRFKYRVIGREKLLAIGRYPEVSLQRARKARDIAREQLALGTDPSAVKKAEKVAAASARDETFAALCASFLARQKKEGRAQTTIAKNTWLLDMAVADFGALPAVEVRPGVILKTLQRVEARGTHETACRLRSIIGTVMRYGIALGWLDGDPTPALKGALIRPQPKPRAAITDERKLGGLLRAIDDLDGQVTTKIALNLMALLYPRPGELRMAKWDEFDLEKRQWLVPGERMKMRRPHRVPLSADVLALLGKLRGVTGWCDLAFPSIRSPLRPMSENTLNAALRRLGYSSDEMSAHGFRAAFSTIANESGLWHPDAIERALAHVEADDVRRAYARGEYWEERVRMADWWAEKLRELRSIK